MDRSLFSVSEGIFISVTGSVLTRLRRKKYCRGKRGGGGGNYNQNKNEENQWTGHRNTVSSLKWKNELEKGVLIWHY